MTSLTLLPLRLSSFILVFWLLGLFVVSSVAAHQQGDANTKRSFQALRLEPGENITVDGVLAEAAWDRAEPAGEFVQQEPSEGGAPTERTDVFVVYSRDYLYVGAMLYDSEPDGILGHQKQRDRGLGGDDRFMWMFDTFLDGRTGYFFETNPAGLLGDGLMRASSGRRGLSKEWDGIWNVKTVQSEMGWSVEIEIPFRTLNFDESLDTWGINFQRTIRRKQEELLWSGHRRNQGMFQAVHAGLLTGLYDISQGLGLEVKPYGTAAWRDVSGEATTPSDLGFDLNYNLTPSLKAAFSINTDFAETEVDRRRVNLTRFPLYYPEQRDFFLENASVFDISSSSLGSSVFFSRNIGLAGGQEVPIVFGSRLTGQAGAYDLGFIQVRTARSDKLGVEDFTVGRVKRNFWRQSTVGMLYTRRATGTLNKDLAPLDRHTIAADLNLMTSTFLGDKNLQFEAFYVVHNGSKREGTANAGDRSARGIRLNYPNDIWRAHVSYREFGDDYSPALGFTPRNGFRRLQPSFSWNPRPARWGQVRQIENEIRYEHLLTLDNVLQTQKVQLTLFQLEFESGDRLGIRASNSFERLDKSFEISDGVVLATGDYRYNDFRIDARTASQRVVSGNVGFSAGEFWSGRRTSTNLNLSVRPYQGITLSSNYRHDNVNLPEGKFSTDLVRMSGEWHVSPWTSVTSNVQYDSVSDVVGLFGRLRWIVTPGSDFFLVYAHNWQYDPNWQADPMNVRNRFVTLSRGAATKINYTHRF